MIYVCMNVQPETKICFGNIYIDNFNLHEEVPMKVFFIFSYFIIDFQKKPPGSNYERKTKLFQLFF